MKVAFCDSSALVKLIVEEPESRALRQGLQAYSKVVASQLATVEVLQAIRRRDPERVAVARRLMRNLETVTIHREVIERAASLDPADVRSLDALQVACALHLAELDPVFIAYDKRTLRPASLAGLRVSSPA